MSDSLDDLLGTNASSGQSDGGALRKQLETILEQNKQLQAQLAESKAATRANALGSMFDKHGIPALARDFFPSDTEPTDEAATAFVEKYGALWGASAATAATPPAEQAATQAAQSFMAQAHTPQSQPLTEEQYAAKFAEAKTKDEFLAMLAELSAAGV